MPTARQRSVLSAALSRQRRRITLSALMVTGHQAGEAAVPFLIGVVIDQATGGDATDLVRWLVVLAVVYVGLSFSFRFGERFGERASELIAHDLRLRLTTRILDDRGGADAGRLPGAVVAIATGDAARVGTVAVAVASGVAALAGLSLATVLLLSISLPLGLLVLIGTPPLLWLTHRLGAPLEERSETEQEQAAAAAGTATDLVAGIRVLKGLRAETAAIDRYRGRSREALTSTVRAARTEAAYTGVTSVLSAAFLALAAAVGGVLAARGSITVGQLISCLGLAQFLVHPFSTFSWVAADLAQGRASARRIAAVLDTPPQVTIGDQRLGTPRGQLRLREVTGGGLNGLDLHVTAGELVGIVAEPGDAAALVAQLARETEPQHGTVELDGHPLTVLHPGDVRDALLVAAHHTDLFEGTVGDNIRPRPGHDVSAAIIAAAVDEVARTLPDGLDTPLGEQARTLSGGQRQRIALARALAADPAILVLHDPTTAVDTVTEARVASGLRSLRADRTTILVTTSPALLAATDKIFVVRDGAVTATGTHLELAGTDDFYRTAVLS